MGSKLKKDGSIEIWATPVYDEPGVFGYMTEKPKKKHTRFIVDTSHIPNEQSRSFLIYPDGTVRWADDA